jgi:hypothetical protein
LGVIISDLRQHLHRSNNSNQCASCSHNVGMSSASTMIMVLEDAKTNEMHLIFLYWRPFFFRIFYWLTGFFNVRCTDGESGVVRCSEAQIFQTNFLPKKIKITVNRNETLCLFSVNSLTIVDRAGYHATYFLCHVELYCA